MLVLSRKVGQQILIGDGIAVTVVRISPTAVRIGIDAPEGVPIIRTAAVKPQKGNGSANGGSSQAPSTRPLLEESGG
jgi:carbon storage regulator CsrA